MIQFMAGNLWTSEYLDLVQLLKSIYKHTRITEIYGSHKSTINPIGSARPDYRLPDMTEHEIRAIINRAHSLQVEINYTLNIPCLGPLEAIDEQKLITFLK